MAWFFFHQITCKAYADINEIGVRSILKTCFANPIDISLQSWTDSPALNVMQYEYAHEVQASKQQSQLQLAPASAQQLAEGYERVVVFPVCPVCRIHVRAESRSFLFFFFFFLFYLPLAKMCWSQAQSCASGPEEIISRWLQLHKVSRIKDTII